MSEKKTRQAMRHLAIAALLIAACVGAMLPSASVAEDSLPWRGEYFDNQNLTGDPVFVRDEAEIKNDWGHGRPDSRLGVDHFSVRWTGTFLFDSGVYSFKTHTDDGVRLWLDGVLLIDQWHDRPATLNEQAVEVTSGYHGVRVEYYENIGIAIAHAWWVRVGGELPSHQWRTEYFNNPWLLGAAVLLRDETAINHNWGYNAPAPGVASDNFSIRWTGSIYFGLNAEYTFYATSDDGVRVWIDGGLLIDRWQDQPATTVSAKRYLTEGTHPVIVEYYDHTGPAVIQFWWEPGAPPSPPSVPPFEIIVDDQDPGFQKAGPTSSWYFRSVGYKGHTYWTYNSDAQLYNSAKWFPQLPQAGNYQVYAFVPKQRADTKNARYRIYHNGQEHSYSIDQSIYFDKWVSLGTYYFAANSTEHVYLEDVTAEPYASKKIGFDAVKFVSTAQPGPTVTPVSPPVTPVTPTPPCSIAPILGFGQVWNTNPTVRQRLGCPTQAEISTWSAEETFIGGYMFWRGDLRLIYAVYNNGTWQSFVDNWEEGQMESDPAIVPPAGRYQPKRGFGKVWREQAGVRDKLSWATAEERGVQASWQAYNGGLMLWTQMLGVYVLYNDGTWIQP